VTQTEPVTQTVSLRSAKRSDCLTTEPGAVAVSVASGYWIQLSFAAVIHRTGRG